MHQTYILLLIKLERMASKVHLLHALLFSFFVFGIDATTMTVRNNCADTIWPATLTSSDGPASTTGFELASKGEPFNIEVPFNWSGRIWARTGCSRNNDKFTCATGECGSNQVACNGNGGNPPVSLVEITFAGGVNKREDFYDISLVDGFNLPVKIIPEANCKAVSCAVDINNQGCPPELVVHGTNGGNKVGCKSACLKFNEDKYCCRGEFNTAEKCPPTEYSKIFKQNCPDAYSYAYDDATSTFVCPTGVNYVIEFCP